MSLTCLAPTAFLEYDIALEFLFALVTMLVAIYAFKVYKSTSQKQIRTFGIAFSFISLAYLIQAIFSIFALATLGELACDQLALQTVILNTLGFFGHIVFFITGLALLVYMSFKTNKIRILWLLLLTSIIGIFLGQNIYYSFYTFTSIFLLFLTWRFIENYLKNKQSKSLIIAIAFTMLLIGNLQFLISIDNQIFYISGKSLELVAYMLIMTNFYLIFYRR